MFLCRELFWQHICSLSISLTFWHVCRFRLVIFAGDTSPVEVICHMPCVCEEKGIKYCYIPSKEVSLLHKTYILQKVF